MNRFLGMFVPHHENDYTPDLLQRAALGIMLALVIISFTMSNLYALLWQGSDWLVGAVLPSVVVKNTNAERADLALPALVRSPILDEAARLKAEDMARSGYFAHYSPEGVSPWHWFSQVDYRFAHAGENLAVHFTDSREVVDAWMKSPTHRANIVNGNYREIGVGTAMGRYEGYDTVFVVQLFGTQAATNTVAVDTLSPIMVLAESVPSSTLTALADVEVSEQVAGAEVFAAEESVEPPVVTNVVYGDTVVMYTDTIATSSGLAEASVPEATTPAVEVTEAMPLAALATSPTSLLQRIYLGLGFLAVVALVCSVLIEWRRQRPYQIIYGVGLLCLMSLLFYIHTLVTGGVVIV